MHALIYCVNSIYTITGITQHAPWRDERGKGRERYLQGICRRAASLSSVPGGVQVVLMHAETIKPLLSHLDEKNKNNIRVAVFGNSLPTPTPHHCNHYTNVSNTKVQLHTSSQTWRLWVLVLQQLLQFHAVLGLQCRELLYFGLKSMPNISCILEVKLNFCLSNSLQLPVQLQKKRNIFKCCCCQGDLDCPIPLLSETM